MPFDETRDDKKFWQDEEKYHESKDGFYTRLQLIASVDKEELSLDYLLENGLNGAPQGPTKLINERAELIDYLEKQFDESIENYSWIPFYKELANKLHYYIDRKDELFEIIKDLRKEYKYFNYLNFENVEWWGPRNYIIDPFSVIAVMNRGITDENRRKIATIYANTFDLSTPVPEKFNGVPFLNNMNSFYGDTEDNYLWVLFKEALEYAESKKVTKELIHAFDKVRGESGVGLAMITIGLYWIRPNAFMPLDSISRSYLSKEFSISIPGVNSGGEAYFNFLEEMKTTREGNSFFELSHAAWEYDQQLTEISVEMWMELLSDLSIFSADNLIAMKAILAHDGKATCTQLANKYGRKKNYYKVNIEHFAKKVSAEIERQFSKSHSFEKDLSLLIKRTDAPEEVAGSHYWIVRPELEVALKQIDLSDYPLYVKNKKFAKLDNYFAELNERLVELSFSDIEEIIGQPLAKSATTHRAYWSGPKEHAFPRTWEDNGYRLIDLSLENKKAIFQKKTIGENRLEIIIEAIIELGGEATYSEIYNELKNKSKFHPETFASESNLQASVRQMIQEHSSDSSIYKSSNEDIFYSVEGIGQGVWGVRESIKKYEKKNQIYTDENFSKEVYMSDENYHTIRHLLKEKKNLILQGAPGVGKTYAARRLAYSIMGEKDESRIEFIQFHQNYSYEDFVMGYQPDGEGFSLEDGLFVEFCEKARADVDKKDYFLIIDEINRGNISKIFGELLMTIENDYRGVDVKMPYSGELFNVPENLYIIGMMNTADRSLALIDYALRRRFSFYEMTPGFQTDGFKKYQASLENEHFNQMIERIEGLNIEIKQDPTLGEGFQIGHSYLTNQSKESYTNGWLKRVVQYEIIPMLQEYWFDDEEKVKENSRKLMSVFDHES